MTKSFKAAKKNCLNKTQDSLIDNSKYKDSVWYYNKCLSDLKKQKIMLEKEQEKYNNKKIRSKYNSERNEEIEKEVEDKVTKIHAEKKALEISSINELLAKKNTLNNNHEVPYEYSKLSVDHQKEVEEQKEKGREKIRKYVIEQLQTINNRANELNKRTQAKRNNVSLDLSSSKEPYTRFQQKKLMLEQLELDHERRKLANERTKLLKTKDKCEKNNPIKNVLYSKTQINEEFQAKKTVKESIKNN